jgi:hypothetical protein
MEQSNTCFKPIRYVSISNYSNSYIGSNNFRFRSKYYFTGSAGDSFTTNLAAGITNANLQIRFQQSNQSRIKYNPNSTTATASSLSNEEFVIKSDINKTITVLNPSNQLLIDTMMGSMKVVSLFILLLKFDLD